jgi:hypothetical protein
LRGKMQPHPIWINNWLRHKIKYVEGLHVGVPQGTERYSADQLRKLGVVGIYFTPGNIGDYAKIGDVDKSRVMNRRSLR